MLVSVHVPAQWGQSCINWRPKMIAEQIASACWEIGWVLQWADLMPVSFARVLSARMKHTC